MKAINANGAMQDIVEKIKSKLDDTGIMYRIFYRAKSSASLSKKLSSDKEYGLTKKIQDLIGIRIVLYFNDDIEITRSIVSSIFIERTNDINIDKFNKDKFGVTIYNIVYSLDEDLASILNLREHDERLDTTFELQIRTIFSEGWHEIEHDLRYKYQNDWSNHDQEYRLLNGVYASLENSEWTMMKIFDELAYSHYKRKDWAAMLRQKFRLRFTEDQISQPILDIFERTTDVAKSFFRIDRSTLLKEMCKRGYYYPLNLDNIIYFSNIVTIDNHEISAITPSTMIEEMSL